MEQTKGWVDPFNNFSEGEKPAEEYCTFTPATLLIGEGKVFTEAEVKAMMGEIMREVEQVPSSKGLGWLDIIFPSNVKFIAARHGITL